MAPAGRVLINAPLLKGMKPTSNAKTPQNLAVFLVGLRGRVVGRRQ